jgi:hypothetical protein
MASFSLRSQRTGLYKDFTLLEILKLLGDATNNEIWLEDGEDVYNLSSFRELNTNEGSSSSPQQWVNESPNPIIGLSQFQLSHQPYNNLVLVFWNGLQIKAPTDYQLQGQFIILNNPMNAQDSLQFIYPI